MRAAPFFDFRKKRPSSQHLAAIQAFQRHSDLSGPLSQSTMTKRRSNEDSGCQKPLPKLMGCLTKLRWRLLVPRSRGAIGAKDNFFQPAAGHILKPCRLFSSGLVGN